MTGTATVHIQNTNHRSLLNLGWLTDLLLKLPLQLPVFEVFQHITHSKTSIQCVTSRVSGLTPPAVIAFSLCDFVIAK